MAKWSWEWILMAKQQWEWLFDGKMAERTAF